MYPTVGEAVCLPPAHAGPAETADVETASDGYASRFAGPVGDWFLQVQAEITLALLPPPARGLRVLDVGGGHGQLAPLLVERGYDVVVAGSAEACRKRVGPWLGKGCHFVVASPPNLPYGDRAFQVVVSYRFLPHARAWQLFLAELARVAADTVLIDYPPRLSFNLAAPLFFGLKKRVEGNTRLYRTFRESRIAEVFARCGFVPAARRAEFFLPMALHRLVQRRTFSVRSERVFSALRLTEAFGSPVILKFSRRDR